MWVALKQSIAAWVRINVVSQCIINLVKCYCSWQLSLAWGIRRALCAALGEQEIPGQGGSTALPAASLELCLKTACGGCRDPHPWELLLAVVQGVGDALPWEMRLAESHLWSRRDLRAPHTKWEWQNRVSCAVECSSPSFKGKGCYSHLLDGQHFLTISTYPKLSISSLIFQ